MEQNETLISLLMHDEVCVIPTDTVYGVVGQLASKQAVQCIFDLKRRDDNKPVGTILAASIEQVEAVVGPIEHSTVASLWPGPVSVIFPADDSLRYAHRGADSLAFRVPADKSLRELLELTGPLASSSANLQAFSPANTVEEAKSYFGDMVPLYVDGGNLADRTPSRIVRIAADGTLEAVRS